MKYRIKPCEIEAVQFVGTNLKEIEEFCEHRYCVGAEFQGNRCIGIKIEILGRYMDASIGDYIIKGLFGEFYPCKPDIFENLYEQITE